MWVKFSWKSALRKDVEELQINDAQIASLKQTVDNIEATLKTYEKDLTDHENSLTINQQEDGAHDLELNQDSLEQCTRKYNVEVHGFPEKRDENLKVVIISIASQLDVDICSQNIDGVHCLQKKPPAIKRPSLCVFRRTARSKNSTKPSSSCERQISPVSYLDRTRALILYSSMKTSQREERNFWLEFASLKRKNPAIDGR